LDIYKEAVTIQADRSSLETAGKITISFGRQVTRRRGLCEAATRIRKVESGIKGKEGGRTAAMAITGSMP